MSNPPLRSNELDLQLNLKDGAGIQSRRKMELSSSGAFLIEDVLEIKGTGAMTFVMCDAWLLELFELEAGQYFFMRGAERVRPQTRRFGTFYPPFSIMRVCFEDVRGSWRGAAATARLPEKLSTMPMMFETDFNVAPRSVEQVWEILDSSGIPLFPEIGRQLDLELLDCKAHENGCVQVYYRVKN